MTLTHLSLFSGIGGLDLAAHWAGFQTVAFCEQNKFCQEVLGKHWPGVPIYDDIFTLTATALAGRGIEPGSVTLISGGFPCQPYSFAGKRVGNADDRALWPQMLRVIREVRPLYVLGENVPGLISLALDGVLSDLESEGYSCQTVVLPACAVNAPHRRDRVFIVAHSKSGRSRTFGQNSNQTGATETFSIGSKTMAHTEGREDRWRERGKMAEAPGRGQGFNATVGFGREDVADTESAGQSWRKRGEQAGWHESDRCDEITTYPKGQGFPLTRGQQRGRGESGQPGFERGGLSNGWQAGQWSTQSGVGMLADGVPQRVAKLKALGNSVVPQQVYPILKAIADYELQGQIA